MREIHSSHLTTVSPYQLGLFVAVSVIVGISAAAQALGGAELHYRSTAILDPLTGLLTGKDCGAASMSSQSKLASPAQRSHCSSATSITSS